MIVTFFYACYLLRNSLYPKITIFVKSFFRKSRKFRIFSDIMSHFSKNSDLMSSYFFIIQGRGKIGRLEGWKLTRVLKLASVGVSNPAHKRACQKLYTPIVKLTFSKKPAILLNMNAERTIPAVLNQIQEELLPSIAGSSAIQTTENLQRFRSRLHSLHYYCVRARIPDSVCRRVEGLLSTSADFWHLMTENELMLTNLKEYTRVRTFSAEADGITNLEELLSGEDSLRDVIINSVAFMLNWKANSIWVDSAKRARTAMAKNYTLEIQDRIWQFIKESETQSEEIDVEHAEQVRERADKLLAVIYASDLPTEAQVALLMQIYTLLLRLQLGQLILQLESLQ